MKLRFTLLLLGVCTAISAHAADPVTLNWLGGTPPATAANVTWGVPWPRGAVPAGTPLRLTAADGRPLEVESWPLAYWPDGSLKWTGHALAAPAGLTGPLTLAAAPGDAATGPSATHSQINYTDDATAFTIDTGVLVARIAKRGDTFFESLKIGARTVGAGGRLIALREDRTDYESSGLLREERFVSRVRAVTLEQSSPQRAVIKVEGTHHAVASEREWLPFTVGLYFHAGSADVRLVHTIIYDGGPARDFIKGLGLSFTVPFAEELHNRHLRFAGDDAGIWVQPVRMLPGYRPQAGAQVSELYAAHLAGRRIPNLAELTPQARDALITVPVWADARFSQPGPNSWSIHKRTSADASWLHFTDGRRAAGFAVLGDVSGGLAVGVKDFWQKHPASLELLNGAADAGEIRVWLWSPDAPAMDLRRYDEHPHGLAVTYEDWKPGWGTPLGIANTHELTLRAFSTIPPNEELTALARATGAPPILVATPDYYHALHVFGNWSLPDRSTPTLRWIEDQVQGLVDFYRTQVEERSWYGFWDYGDIMHNYDFGRHEWRYDVGGWAWVNTELMPDMLLWYSFLRTGRANLYRFAEAMTRHTSEVDVHHLGGQMTGPRMLAYVAHRKNDPELGRLAWEKLIGTALTPAPQPRPYNGPDVVKPVTDPAFLGASVDWQLHGVASVQWALNAIETLELARPWLPLWEKSTAQATTP